MRPSRAAYLDANAPRQVERLLGEHPPIRTLDGGQFPPERQGLALGRSERGGVARANGVVGLVGSTSRSGRPLAVPSGLRITRMSSLPRPSPTGRRRPDHVLPAADEQLPSITTKRRMCSDALVRFHLERPVHDEVPAQFEGESVGRVEA